MSNQPSVQLTRPGSPRFSGLVLKARDERAVQGPAQPKATPEKVEYSEVTNAYEMEQLLKSKGLTFPKLGTYKVGDVEVKQWGSGNSFDNNLPFALSQNITETKLSGYFQLTGSPKGFAIQITEALAGKTGGSRNRVYLWTEKEGGGYEFRWFNNQNVKQVTENLQLMNSSQGGIKSFNGTRALKMLVEGHVVLPTIDEKSKKTVWPKDAGSNTPKELEKYSLAAVTQSPIAFELADGKIAYPAIVKEGKGTKTIYLLFEKERTGDNVHLKYVKCFEEKSAFDQHVKNLGQQVQEQKQEKRDKQAQVTTVDLKTLENEGFFAQNSNPKSSNGAPVITSKPGDRFFLFRFAEQETRQFDKSQYTKAEFLPQAEKNQSGQVSVFIKLTPADGSEPHMFVAVYDGTGRFTELKRKLSKKE